MSSRPVIFVSGASPLFYQRLIKATIRDEEGQKSDRLTFELDDAGNAVPIPKKGTRLSVRIGTADAGLVDRGTFEVHSTEIKGSCADGEIVVVQANGTPVAGSSKLKEMGSESFPEGTTLKAVLDKVARRAGFSVRLDPALAAISYADGVFRHGQSALDFIGRLAEQAGGIIKIQGGVIHVAKRGTGKNAAGTAMTPVLIRRADVKEWSFTPEDRPTYGSVSAPFIDQASGKKRTRALKTGQDGPVYAFKQVFKSEAEARKAAESKAGDLSRKTGNFTVTLAGVLEGGAGAQLMADGFRPEINGEWRVKAREDVFTSGPGGGWLTTFECTAPEGGKKG